MRIFLFQTLRSESKNDVENRYSAEYENKLDPFTTFSQRVRSEELFKALNSSLLAELCVAFAVKKFLPVFSEWYRLIFLAQA